ncbi:hypothetical protein [Nocardia mangyaensis]|uniref:hypothetical protein n=1 Tax=Nocardia mangyaensis TaxID=2213200 RepID=UPI00267533AB|nr:hypothetical protein [Nocardia mangyaensis]MDO3651160.1 hypothetical protein [Nocardia mangyaensis]
MGIRMPRRSSVDLSSEAPADVAKSEEHELHFSGPGFSGKLNSSGNAGVGRALAFLVLVGTANGTGYLVAELVDRYLLHPGVAIPLVLGVGLAVLGSGLWLIASPAAEPARRGEAGTAHPRRSPRIRGVFWRRSTPVSSGGGAASTAP